MAEYINVDYIFFIHLVYNYNPLLRKNLQRIVTICKLQPKLMLIYN